MSRILLGASVTVLAIAACSSSSKSGFGGDAGGGDGGGLPPIDGSGPVPIDASGDGPAPTARGAVDARLTGASCLDRLALKLGSLSPQALLANGDPNGGDAVTVACTVTTATGAYTVSFGTASSVSFGVRATDKSAALLSNEVTQYAADTCTVVTLDVGADHVIGSLKCPTTTVGGGSSGNPAPSPCELDADFTVYGCVTR